MVKIIQKIVTGGLLVLLATPTVHAMYSACADLTHAQPTMIIKRDLTEDECAGVWYCPPVAQAPAAQIPAAAHVLPTEVPESPAVYAVSDLLERRRLSKPVACVNIEAADAVAGHQMYVRNTPGRFVRPEPGAFNAQVVAAETKREYMFCPPQYMLANSLKAYFGLKYVGYKPGEQGKK